MSDLANEKTSLLGGDYLGVEDIAASLSKQLGLVILCVQIAAAAIIFTLFGYQDVADYDSSKYMIFRDIMVMLLLGFGYLMTFLEKYGLSSVGLTMLLTALNMECNLVVEGLLSGNRVISLDAIIDAEFSAATLLISFGALIGRATPLQMCALAVAESVFYAANKVFLVFGYFQAEDVGGTMTIHMFGAFFGLAAAYALGPQNKPSASNNAASRVSDVFAFVGTTLLWVYWPSFVGATETGSDRNEMLCLTNTIMALIGSTGATFYLSQELNKGKFDAVHIQNSTLAGGVAIGSTARLAMGPGTALIVGMMAGAISVLGYFYGSPFLEKKLGLYDTCGVANLHGLPSVLGGLLSIAMVYVYQPDAAEDILQHEVGTQSVMQLAAVVGTLVVAIGSGYVSGTVVLANPLTFRDVPDYEDAVWWEMES
jgi:ammonium transporter Rh